MTNNTLPIDLDKAKLSLLLQELAFERLDRDGAIELRPLLVEVERFVDNPRDRRNIEKTIKRLDKYINGEINLMQNIDVPISIA